MAEQKKAVLVVSFGTSHTDTRIKTIDKIEQAIVAALPERTFYRAWTSGMIIRKIFSRDGQVIPTVSEAMEQLVQDGITDVLVQPTHILNGIENDIMLQNIATYNDRMTIRVGAPLLTNDEDMEDAVKAVMAQFTDLADDTALVLMGHGTEHYVNPVYAALNYRFHQMGYKNVFVGTVESYPTVDEVLAQVTYNKYKNVVLTPFMIVAGDHASNDMAGDEDDSWKVLFQNAGFQVSCVLRGLGEYDEICDMLVAHATAIEE